MATRLFPPPAARSPIRVGGRTYLPGAAAVQDVHDADASVLLANGWTAVAAVGVTAERPVPGDGTVPAGANLRGAEFIDVSLGAVVVHDGSVWRNALTGAVA
jgi:hypothetical protein